MSRLFLIGVVGVFRRCPVCERWYRTGSFSKRATRCGLCYRPEPGGRRGRGGAPSRSYMLTDKARALLAAERHVA